MPSKRLLPANVPVPLTTRLTLRSAQEALRLLQEATRPGTAAYTARPRQVAMMRRPLGWLIGALEEADAALEEVYEREGPPNGRA